MPGLTWEQIVASEAVVQFLQRQLGHEPWLVSINVAAIGEEPVVRVTVQPGTRRARYAHLLRGDGRIGGIQVRVRKDEG